MVTQVNKYVVVGAAGGGDGSIGSPWNTIDALEGLTTEKDLVGNDETWTVHVSTSNGNWDNANSASPTRLFGWTTDSTHRLKISGDGQYHNGHIAVSKYSGPSFTSYVRRNTVSNNGLIIIQSDWVELVGFQAYNVSTNSQGIRITSGVSNCKIERCLIHGSFGGSNLNDCGIYIENNCSNIEIFNNFIHYFNVGIRIVASASSNNIKIWNNTIYQTGSTSSGYGISAETGTSGEVKNNICQNQASSGLQISVAAGWTVENNLTDDSSGTSGLTNINLSFVSVPADNNWHLAVSDTEPLLKGNRISLVSNDIDLDLRGASLVDLGADQVSPAISLYTAPTGFLFLFNDAANASSGIVNPALESGYVNSNIAYGSRQDFLLSTNSSSDKRFGYEYDEETDLDHFIITRADLLNTVSGNEVDLDVKIGTSWNTISGNLNISDNLVGLSEQDYVIAQGVLGTKGAAFNIKPNATERTKLAGITASKAFEMGEPEINKVFITTIDNSNEYYSESITISNKIRHYQVSHSIRLTFPAVLRDTWEEFLTKPVFKHPFYIYDSESYVFKHKLEHVILDSFEAIQLNNNYFEVTINLFRLRQHD